MSASAASPNLDSPAPEAFPEGWQLGSESWTFHRQFFIRMGRPTAHGEYAALHSQIRWHIAPRLDRYHYQVTLLDGSPLIVRGGWKRLNGVEPSGWISPAKVPAPGHAPSVALAKAAPPLRASTLTLGNPAAARVLADRMRRAGITGQVPS